MNIDPQQLQEFVHESNRIEGIPAKSGMYHDIHLAAAKAVMNEPKDYLSDTRRIHQLLEKTFDLGTIAGEYRVDSASCGYRNMPDSQMIQTLMQRFHREAILITSGDESYTHVECIRLAWQLHNQFVCIHPFSDGNGRVARLILNAFCVLYDHPLVIVRDSGRTQYFEEIRRYEDKYFLPHLAKQHDPSN